MDYEDGFYLSLPTLLKIIAGTVIVVLVTLYILFQGRHLITGPVISLTEDIPPQVATSTVMVRGIAENIVSLTLQGRTIYTTDAGVFDEVVVLPIGYTVITLVGVDRYGTTKTFEQPVVRTE